MDEKDAQLLQDTDYICGGRENGMERKPQLFLLPFHFI